MLLAQINKVPEKRHHIGQFLLFLADHPLRMPLGGKNGFTFMLHRFNDPFFRGDGGNQPLSAIFDGLVVIGIGRKVSAEELTEQTIFLCCNWVK